MVSTSLNDQYAAFGTIDKDGMNTVDKIVKDYLKKGTDSGMGVMIEDEDEQAKITSIVIDD